MTCIGIRVLVPLLYVGTWTRTLELQKSRYYLDTLSPSVGIIYILGALLRR